MKASCLSCLEGSQHQFNRRCIEWLKKLARGEKVVVNLRASIDPKTAYTGIDREWVFRVLKRVAANLERLSGNLFPTEESEVKSNAISAGVKLRLNWTASALLIVRLLRKRHHQGFFYQTVDGEGTCSLHNPTSVFIFQSSLPTFQGG